MANTSCFIICLPSSGVQSGCWAGGLRAVCQGFRLFRRHGIAGLGFDRWGGGGLATVGLMDVLKVAVCLGGSRKSVPKKILEVIVEDCRKPGSSFICQKVWGCRI